VKCEGGRQPQLSQRHSTKKQDIEAMSSGNQALAKLFRRGMQRKIFPPNHNDDPIKNGTLE
jgi:hypothetical protein